MLREELMSAATSKDVERRRNLLSDQQETEFVRDRLEHIRYLSRYFKKFKEESFCLLLI